MISVIIPVFEEEKHLRECFDSVLNQTEKDIEVIIVDDASKDGSRDIIEEYAKNDSRIKVFFNEENMGAGPTRNVGIDNADGDYITFVDCDDWIDKDYIKTMAVEVEKDPELDLVLIGSFTYDGETYKKTTQVNQLYVSGKEYVTAMLSGKVINGGGNHSKLYSRRVVDNVRYRSFRCAQDGLFSRECLKYINKAKSVDYSGYYYRITQEVRHETRAAKTEDFYERQITCAALTVKAAEDALFFFGIDKPECKDYVSRFKWTEFEILYRRILFDVYIKMSARRKVNCIKKLLKSFYPPDMLAYTKERGRKLLQSAFKKNSFILFYMWMIMQPHSIGFIMYANVFPKNSWRGRLVRKVYKSIARKEKV